MPTLLIKVECGKLTCNRCRYKERLGTDFFCDLDWGLEFFVRLDTYKQTAHRCPACLEAERKAKEKL